MNYEKTDNEYLIHHGIKGQKWGVRRFQNENGTLTGAGKRRYGIEFGNKNRVTTNTGNKDQGPTKQPPNKLKGKNSQLEPSNEKNGYYKEFYNAHDARFRTEMNANRRPLDKVNDQYRVGVSTAAKKFIQSEGKGKVTYNLSTNPQDYTISGGVWHNNNAFSGESSGNGKNPDKVYSPAELPEAIRLAKMQTNLKEVEEILDQNVLITDQMINGLLNGADSNVDDYEKALDEMGKEFSKNNPALSYINTQYGKATLSGNNAITSYKTANAMKAAQRQQREDPVMFTKALVNTVSQSVSEAIENSPLINEAKRFFKAIF